MTVFVKLIPPSTSSPVLKWIVTNDVCSVINGGRWGRSRSMADLRAFAQAREDFERSKLLAGFKGEPPSAARAQAARGARLAFLKEIKPGWPDGVGYTACLNCVQYETAPGNQPRSWAQCRLVGNQSPHR